MFHEEVLIKILQLLIITVVVLLAVYLVLKLRARKREALQREYAATLVQQELELLAKKEKMKKGAVSVKIVHQENNNYQFEITNSGGIDLRQVEMQLLLDDEDDNPINPSEYADKLPISRLKKGTVVNINATQYAGSPTKYNLVLRWIEPDGSKVEDELCINL